LVGTSAKVKRPSCMVPLLPAGWAVLYAQPRRRVSPGRQDDGRGQGPPQAVSQGRKPSTQALKDWTNQPTPASRHRSARSIATRAPSETVEKLLEVHGHALVVAVLAGHAVVAEVLKQRPGCGAEVLAGASTGRLRTARSVRTCSCDPVSTIPRQASPGTTRPRRLCRLSCGGALRRGLQKGACGCRTLHTAEATGSKPVTPTSTNASQRRSSGALARDCHRITARAWSTLVGGPL
jgi:hypothetical protein